MSNGLDASGGPGRPAREWFFYDALVVAFRPSGPAPTDLRIEAALDPDGPARTDDKPAAGTGFELRTFDDVLLARCADVGGSSATPRGRRPGRCGCWAASRGEGCAPP